MKIEKINENQIRCTLTKEDLKDRQIKISDMAYGSEKAKDLFRDMMDQAAYEYGFEVDDIPIMIEAVPLNSECILLVITKVENPEELDTRFSHFTAQAQEAEEILSAGATDILDLFSKLRSKEEDEPADFIPLSESLGAKKQKTRPQRQLLGQQDQAALISDITKLYSFASLEEAQTAASVIDTFYHGENTLYKNHQNDHYYLFIKKSDHSPEEYNKLCNILSEYAHQETCTPGIEAFYGEHGEAIIEKNAMQVLGRL